MEDSNDGAQTQQQVGGSDDNKAKIEQVRSKALEELLILLPEANSVDAERRFDIYVNDLHETGNTASAEAALEAALAIEDKDARANALSELVDEVDYYEASRSQEQ